MERIVARAALLPSGWADMVALDIGDEGQIASIETAAEDARTARGILLPAPANLHSHGFQRALAGLTERRARPDDSFWTWRTRMYALVERLTPEAIEAITALAQAEMLEAGWAAVGEFHYVHHDRGGASYAEPAETSLRVIAAAQTSGVGLTHLPTLYAHGGPGGAPLEAGQLRMGCDLDRFARIRESAALAIERELDADARIGWAAHSLRATTPDLLKAADFPGPIHIHAAEQKAEVEAIEAWLGDPPVRFLLDAIGIDRRWCLVHATHLREDEILDLAASGAVAGLCPITEANLGDGLFAAPAYLRAGGAIGVGSDQNVGVDLAGELRTLEYGQRSRDRARCVAIAHEGSIGRALFERALEGGAQALARDAGALAPGKLADLLLLDGDAIDFAGLDGDAILDAWIFGGARAIDRVYAAGRLRVAEGRHIARDAIERAARAALTQLRAAL